MRAPCARRCATRPRRAQAACAGQTCPRSRAPQPRLLARRSSGAQRRWWRLRGVRAARNVVSSGTERGELVLQHRAVAVRLCDVVAEHARVLARLRAQQMFALATLALE